MLLFVNANVIHHVKERGAFIGENAKGTHGEIYKSHTSVISSHFVDQVHIFFFRLRAVPLQSVESKLGRTGEGEMAERETGERQEEEGLHSLL